MSHISTSSSALVWISRVSADSEGRVPLPGPSPTMSYSPPPALGCWVRKEGGPSGVIYVITCSSEPYFLCCSPRVSIDCEGSMPLTQPPPVSLQHLRTPVKGHSTYMACHLLDPCCHQSAHWTPDMLQLGGASGMERAALQAVGSCCGQLSSPSHPQLHGPCCATRGGWEDTNSGERGQEQCRYCLALSYPCPALCKAWWVSSRAGVPGLGRPMDKVWREGQNWPGAGCGAVRAGTGGKSGVG